MSNANNIGDAAQPHPMPQPTPLMSVDTSAMAPLVGGAAPPLMQQDHTPRPPWDGPVPLQPSGMVPSSQFGGASSGSGGPRQVPEPNKSNVMRPPEQKLGILPTPPAYMKLIPDNPQVPAPVNTSINPAVQDPRSSSDPRMNQQQQHLKRQHELFESSSHGETFSNEITATQLKEQDNQADNDDTKQTDDFFPLFQPLEPPKELSRQKPHFIPDLPSPAVGVIDDVDASLPSHIARPTSIPHHHSIDQSPSRPRNLKSKYSHLKVKSRTSKSGAPSEEQSQLLTIKRDNAHKSILKRTADKPKEPFSIYSHDGTEENTGYGEIHPMFSNRTSAKASSKEDSKSSNPDKAANDDSDKPATKKDSSVPYYAMFDTGFGSDLQIDSAFGSLED